MKLDRNLNADGRGKYALVKLRNLRVGDTAVDAALRTLDEAGLLDWGNTVDTEFFAIRLRDRFAAAALNAYAIAAHFDDPEYAGEINQMVLRAGPRHPNSKVPD